MFNLRKVVSVTCILATVLCFTGCSKSTSVATPLVKDVVKDVVKDDAKEVALNAIYGVDTKDSLSSLFSSSKFSNVTADDQSFLKGLKKDYYSEVYYRENDDYVYVGDRYKNNPNNVNFKWNRYNATDFEIGNFKSGIAYTGTYIAYDSETATLVMGELEKGKFIGNIILYDAYNNQMYIKNDKCINCFSENNLTIYHDDGNGYEYDHFCRFAPNENTEVTFFTNRLDDITYKSDTCEFYGTPFKFTCTYKYDAENSITFDYTVLQNVLISQTDGTEGELKIVESDESQECKVLSDYLIDLGVKSVSKLCVDTIEAGFPSIKLLDAGLEVTTGDGLEDRLTDLIKSGFEENIGNKVVDSVKDKVDTFINGEDSQEKRNNPSFEDKMDWCEERGIKITFD